MGAGPPGIVLGSAAFVFASFGADEIDDEESFVPSTVVSTIVYQLLLQVLFY